MTFDEMIDELQEQFIFNIRNEHKLMDKLHTLWLREEIKQGRTPNAFDQIASPWFLFKRPVETNDQQ
tara:strand:- start:82 stop:282 length:201 start_codon:yes stop_codon:yes gene_type:complete